jgi:hypothetical protein
MSHGAQQAKVLLATLTEAVSGRGNTYMRGWLGASNLVAFAGEPDEQGRPTWNLYLVERQPRDGAATAAKKPHERNAGPLPPAGTAARSGDRYNAPKRESEAKRQERVAAEIVARYGDGDLNDPLPF